MTITIDVGGPSMFAGELLAQPFRLRRLEEEQDLVSESTDSSSTLPYDEEIMNYYSAHKSKDSCCDRPPPVEPISIASTTKTSSTTSSWSTDSEPESHNHKNIAMPDVESFHFVAQFPDTEEDDDDDETTLYGDEHALAAAAIAAEFCDGSPGSFHFVSDFPGAEDEDNESTVCGQDEAFAAAAAAYDCNDEWSEGCSFSTSTDKNSMVVCTEQEIDAPTRDRAHTLPSVASGDPNGTLGVVGDENVQRIELPHNFEVVTIQDDVPINRCRTYSVTTTNTLPTVKSGHEIEHKIELPNNFEVVTIQDDLPSNRGRTYSVTTTASITSRPSNPSNRERRRRFSSGDRFSIAAETATIATADETAYTEPSVMGIPMARPSLVQANVRSPSAGDVSLANRFRKIMNLRPKTMASC